MRIAAIDIGTNSVHMVVADVRPDRSFEVVDREKEMIRLGAGGMNGRALTERAMRSALDALGRFARLAASRRVDTVVAAATSAVRESSNGGEFLRAVKAATGIDAAVISGVEEARLIHLAAVYGVDVGRGLAVVIDIGGGSTEITFGTAAGARLARSFKLGVIRLAERFVRSDPLTGRDERRLVRHITEQIRPTASQITEAGFDRVIGTSGTIRAIAEMAVGDEAAGEELHHRRLSAKQLRRLRKQLVALDLEGRLELPNLDPRRADLLVPGAVLLDTIIRRLGAAEITLSDYALREGLLIDYTRRHAGEIARSARYPDIRRRSVVELAERCGYTPEHATQVARLALALFDQTRPVHGLTDRAREWLEFASLLHDIGLHISYGRHHKHSYYLIKNGGLRGFEPDEVEAIALVARYHRRAAPNKAHDGFGVVSPPVRRAVRATAAMLRVAEALDRSHSQVVDRIVVEMQRRDAVVVVHAHGDAELETWAASRQLAPLADVLERELRVETRQA
jgi:exopolyphosphatase/guanosine-5'-triphosphate,3'-diphosphate pyrophosphatase